MDLSEELIQVQHRVLQEATSKTTHSSKLFWFTQMGPGQFGYTELPVQALDLQRANLSEDTLARLKAVARNVLAAKGVEFEVDRVLDCVLVGLKEHYILSTPSQFSRTHEEAISRAVTEHAEEIVQWCSVRQSVFEVVVQLVPSFRVNTEFRVGGWEFHSPNLVEASRISQTSGESAQEGLSRFLESVFVSKAAPLVSTAEVLSLLQDIDRLLISVFMASGAPVLVDRFQAIMRPWRFAPDPISFVSMPIFGEHFYDPRLSRSLSFQSWASLRAIGPTEIGVVADVPTASDFYNLLEEIPEATFSFKMIMQGVREVFEANSYNVHLVKKEERAISGIYHCLAGLEGLNSKCKGASRREARATFVDCWSTIIARRQSRNPKSVLGVIKDPRIAAKRLYSLRSDIAHADPADLPRNLLQVMEAFELRGELSPFGYLLAPIVAKATFELLREFVDDAVLLKGMFSGRKPK